MSPRDGRELAHVLLERAAATSSTQSSASMHSRRSRSASRRSSPPTIGDAGVEVPALLEDAQELAPWAVEFRYETESEPALDRAATIDLVEQIRAWAVSAIDA